MWKRKKRQEPEPEPRPARTAISKFKVPAVELVDGWTDNPMNLMPDWSGVRRQAAFELADESTRGFILLRVHHGTLPGNRERVEVDLCVMPYQRRALRDTLESIARQLT